MSKIYGKIAMAFALAGLLTALVSNGVDAVPPAAPGVPQLLDQILQAIADLQDGVDALGNPAQEKDRFTPIGSARTGLFEFCSVVNVSASTRQVHVELRFANGTVVQSVDLSLAAGVGSPQGAARLNNGTSSEQFYCAYSVVDGTKADIRGALRVETTLGETLLEVPAE